MQFFRDPSWQQLCYFYHASKVILGIAIPVGQNRERIEGQTWKVMASPNGPTPYHTHSHSTGMNSATWIHITVSEAGSEEDNDSWWAAAVSTTLVWHSRFRNYDLRVRDPRKNQGFGIDGFIREKRQKTRQICHEQRSHSILHCLSPGGDGAR